MYWHTARLCPSELPGVWRDPRAFGESHGPLCGPLGHAIPPARAVQDALDQAERHEVAAQAARVGLALPYDAEPLGHFALTQLVALCPQVGVRVLRAQVAVRVDVLGRDIKAAARAQQPEPVRPVKRHGRLSGCLGPQVGGSALRLLWLLWLGWRGVGLSRLAVQHGAERVVRQHRHDR